VSRLKGYVVRGKDEDGNETSVGPLPAVTTLRAADGVPLFASTSLALAALRAVEFERYGGGVSMQLFAVDKDGSERPIPSYAEALAEIEALRGSLDTERARHESTKHDLEEARRSALERADQADAAIRAREVERARRAPPLAAPATLVFVAKDGKILCVAFPSCGEAIAYSSEIAGFEGAFIVDRREVGGLDMSRFGAKPISDAEFDALRYQLHAHIQRTEEHHSLSTTDAVTDALRELRRLGLLDGARITIARLP